MSCPSQKVIIPKGLVNPNETTIVEIPTFLRNADTIIARAKTDFSFGVNRYLDSTESSAEASPQNVQPKVIKKRSYTRRSFPPPSRKQNRTGGFGTTFGGVPFEESMDESSHGFHPYVPRTPPTPKVPDYNSFRRDINKVNSTHQDISFKEGSLYRDFRPNRASSRREASPGRTPGSMRKYLSVSPQPEMSSSGGYTGGSGGCTSSSGGYTSGGGGYTSGGGGYTSGVGGGYSSSGGGGYASASGGYTSSSVEYSGGDNSGSGQYFAASDVCPPNICKTSITTSTPEEIQTTEYSEESWVDNCNPSPVSPPPSGPTSSTFDDSYCSPLPRALSATPTSPGGKMTQGDLLNSLGQLESCELQKITGDLSNFQSARRKLVFDASSLASAADVSSNLLHHTV